MLTRSSFDTLQHYVRTSNEGEDKSTGDMVPSLLGSIWNGIDAVHHHQNRTKTRHLRSPRRSDGTTTSITRRA